MSTDHHHNAKNEAALESYNKENGPISRLVGYNINNRKEWPDASKLLIKKCRYLED